MWKQISAVILLSLVCGLAHGAQKCNSSEACVSWRAPTQNTNGTSITGAITYRVISGTLSWQTTALEIKLTGLPRGLRCFRVVAVVNGVESAASSEACKTIRFAGPTDGAIEDKR